LNARLPKEAGRFFTINRLAPGFLIRPRKVSFQAQANRIIMLNIECRRCGSRFYSASPESIKKCPYCSFDLHASEPVRRQEERAEIKKDCLLVKGALSLAATATDISQKGVGIRIHKAAPINIDDSIHIVIEELDIDSDARVVWIKQADGPMTETGLIFDSH